MFTLLPVFILIAAVSSTDLEIGTEGGRKIYDEKLEANPAIWTQMKKLTVNATGNEVISRVVVTDLRTNKDGEVKIVEGGEGQKNVTLELMSPSVLRGYEFQVQVFAAPDRKGRETVAETPAASEEGQSAVDTSVPIVNDTEINEGATAITTDVVNGTAEVSGTSVVETPVESEEQMKKRDTVPELNQESQDTNPEESQGSESKDVPQETQGSDSEDVPQESVDPDNEDEPQEFEIQDTDSAAEVQEPVHEQTMKKRDTGDMGQESQVDVYQSQESHDSGEEEVAEEEESTDEEQQKRAAQEMPQIQISGEMPEVQMPEIQIPEVQLPEIQIPNEMPQVQIGVENDEQPQERAAQETPETQVGEEMPQVHIGEEMPQEGELLPEDPIAQYVSEQKDPIQAPLVPEVMLEESNSTHFNDSAVVVERSAYKYEEETEPPTEPTEPPTEPTTEETTTEPPTEPTTEKENEKHHYHHYHNWHESHGY